MDRFRRKARIESEIDADIRKLNEESTQERDELNQPHIKWPLIRQAWYKRKNIVDVQRVPLHDFRRKKGFFLQGKERSREFIFQSQGISEDLYELAEREIDDEERESRKPTREQYRQERHKQTADVVEAMMADTVRSIFGSDAQVVFSSEFDDRRNSLDLLLIFRDKSGGIDQIFGVDFTSAGEQKFIEKKLIQALRSIVRGKLSTAVYIAAPSLEAGKKGQMEYFSANGIPRMIIPLSPMTALLMAKRWVSDDGVQTVENFLGPERKKALLYSVLEQYRAQLILSREKDAEGGLTEPSFATRELQRAYQRVDAILKKAGLENLEIKQKSDRTLKRLRETVRSLSSMRTLYKRAMQAQASRDEKFAQEKMAKNGR